MTAKIYLSQIRVLSTKIEKLWARAKGLREQAQALLSLELKTDVVQASKPASPMEEKVVKYLDLEQEIVELTTRLEKTKQRIIADIFSLDDERYINVLYKRYVEGKPFIQVSREMHYSCEYTRQLARQAERKMEDTLQHLVSKRDKV